MKVVLSGEGADKLVRGGPAMPLPYLYLLAHGYSGSTLLTLLLGAHPGIATFGEMVIAPKYRMKGPKFPCSCGATVEDCAFWKAVSLEMRRRGHDFEVWESHLSPPTARAAWTDRILARDVGGPVFEATRSFVATAWPPGRRSLQRAVGMTTAVAEVITALKGRKSFLDSSKVAQRAILLRNSRHLRMKVIHLVRDGRGVANSCMKNRHQAPPEAAQSWVRAIRAAERVRRRFDARDWVSVRYEDLCRNPSGELSRIFAFAGVDDIPVERLDTSTHHVIGNRMRLTFRGRIVLDEKWRTELSGASREAIEQTVGPSNARYGYT